jgi:prepilin-type N-terminal cleavage/methylation domain-containing protein
MRKCRVTSSAFTLLELIFVLVVLAVVAAVAAPKLRGFAVGRAKGDAATVIVSLANYARTQAISEGRNYRLNIDPNSRAIWLTVQNGPLYQPLPGEFGERFTASDSIVRMDTDLLPQPDGQYVTFAITGRTTPPVQIVLTDKLNEKVTVALQSETELFRVLSPGETR